MKENTKTVVIAAVTSILVVSFEEVLDEGLEAAFTVCGASNKRKTLFSKIMVFVILILIAIAVLNKITKDVFGTGLSNSKWVKFRKEIKDE